MDHQKRQHRSLLGATEPERLTVSAQNLQRPKDPELQLSTPIRASAGAASIRPIPPPQRAIRAQLRSPQWAP